MKRWRKHVICLLLVTFPVSLWASVAAPRDCSQNAPAEQQQPVSSAHAHHGMNMNLPVESAGTEAEDHRMHQGHGPDAMGPCCDTCLSACLAGSLTVLDFERAAAEAAVRTMHHPLIRSAHWLAGPSYPSLYRPPISHL